MKRKLSHDLFFFNSQNNNHFSTNVWVYIYSLYFVCCLTNAYLQTTGHLISETSAKPVILLCACFFQYLKERKNNKTFSKENWLVGVRVFISKNNLKNSVKKTLSGYVQICATLFIKNKRILERQTLKHIIYLIIYVYLSIYCMKWNTFCLIDQFNI